MELRLPAPCLVVLVGPSSSGKSTWAAQTFHEGEIVSSDRLRGMVGASEDDQQASKAAFSLLEQIARERMGRRLTTVIDTLGFDQESRRRWIALAHEAGLPAFAIVFDTPTAEIEARNAGRERPIPKTVLGRQISRHRAVRSQLEDDGFDRVDVEQHVSMVPPHLVVPAPDRPVMSGKPGVGHSFGLMVSRFSWDGGREKLGGRLGDIARRAEAAGFRDLWLMDHFRQIPQVGRGWEDMPEAYTTLAYLASVTSTIRLGTLVSSVTHRHPVVLGRMVATLDVLSGGRANLGIGIGWDRDEHDGYGMRFPAIAHRYAMLEDTLQMLPLLWGKGAPGFEGKTFTASALACYPRPIQDPIPIIVGGSGENKTLRLVARYAHGCNFRGRPEVVARKIEVLRRHCTDVGRDPGEIEVTQLVDAMTGHDRTALRRRIDLLRGRNTTAEEFANRHNAATVRDQVAHLGAYRELGVDHSIVVLPDAHLEGSIEAFGEVIENLSHP